MPLSATQVHSRQIGLLRVILIAVVSILGLNTLLAVLVYGPGILLDLIMTPSLIALTAGIVAIGLLARRRLHAAGILATAGFLTGDTWDFFRAGLHDNETSLLMFIVPVILAGLMLRRVTLYVVAALILLVVLGVHALEFTTLGAELALTSTGPALLFSLILIVLTLFFDRFGITLRDALLNEAAVSRENARLYDETLKLNETLEQRVAQRTEELQGLNSELESFSYSVSHDLRSPLRGIQGFSQALLEDYGASLDETGRGYLQRISAGAERMGELIDDLLEFSRLGRAPLELERVDLSELAHAALAELEILHSLGEVDLHVEEGLSARGDPRLLRIVLQNLLGNALKFSQDEPLPRVEVGWSEGEQAFYVRDNGEGFDMQYAEKLFAPFQRLHSPGEYEGTGIGLATSSRIIERHGGRIWALSSPGEGATFYFTLPAGDAPSEPQPAPALTGGR